MENESHEVLIAQIKDLQKRVAAFASVEQQLINVKDRLDSENLLYKRMHAFNARAFEEMTEQAFLDLVAESIIDVFEVETGCVLIGYPQHAQPHAVAIEGGQDSVIDSNVLWHKLFAFCKTGLPGAILQASPEQAASLQPAADFSQLMLVWYNDAFTGMVIKLLGGVSNKHKLNYNPFDAQKLNAFGVFTQHVLAHFVNRKKTRSIFLAQQKLSHIAESFLQFGPDPLQNIQYLVNESCKLLGAGFGFYHSNRQQSFVVAEAPCMQPELILGLEQMTQITRCIQVQADAQGYFTGSFQYPIGHPIDAFTVLGRKVQLGNYTFGEFCICFPGKIALTEENIHFFGIVAGAIAVEKRRFLANLAQIESEQRYRVIFEGTPHGIMLLNAQTGNIAYFNPAISKLFQIEVTQANAVHIEQLHDAFLASNILQQLQEQQQTAFVIGKEIACTRKDGTVFFADITAQKILLGNQTLFTCFYVDVTERKEAEIELQESNNELKKINAELDSFVYSVSHDLRAPLMAMKGLMSLFDTEVLEHGENKEYWGLMTESIARMDETIREILDYSRNTRTELKLEPIGIRKLINDTYQDVQFAVTEPIAFSTDIDDSQIFISDKVRISTVVRNIVSNAVKYRRTGATDNAVHIAFTILPNGYAQLTVADKGEGIATDKLDKVFDMFYRASTSSAGTGLGLYICKEIVQKIGGSIQLTSEKGKGTTVTLLFYNHINTPHHELLLN